MERTERIRVLFVDDSHDVRDGLKSILQANADIEVVGEAVDGSEGITEVERLRPRVVLMDAEMQGVGGIEATRRIKEGDQDVQVILLTVHSCYLEDALAAGADTYLLKDCGRRVLLKAIRELARRE